MSGDAEQTLQSIHKNFIRLIDRVPMVQVEDLPEAMKSQVVGVPWAWVQLFRRLARFVVCYHDQNPPPPPQAQRPESIYFCTTVNYILVARKPQFCIMTLMYYDITFRMLMKNFYDDRLFIYMCAKMYVCDMLMVYEANANLIHSQHMSQQLD